MTIKITKPLELPEVKKLLENNCHLLFELTGEEFSRAYIVKLQLELPNYCVSLIKWMNKLIITPSISTNIVLENLNKFYECILLFDKTAHSLMKLMSTTFDIDLNNPNEIYDLKRNRSDKQRGIINDEWKYHFHGAECSFTNVRTNQFLDVKIIYGTEFGVLDTYYLMKFIQSTNSLKEISVILNDDTNNMRKVIEVLWCNDFLSLLKGGNNNQLILNRNNKDFR